MRMKDWGFSQSAPGQPEAETSDADTAMMGALSDSVTLYH